MSAEPYADVNRLLERAAARLALLPLVERYERRKRDARAMDYGDQMAVAARIAARHPEVGEVERGRFAVVLLDEYQDTSHAQLVLLRSLFGGGHPVTAVGDPCQSIYGWRGASAGNLDRFPPTSARRPATRPRCCRCPRSFRNGERILDVANALSAELRENVPALAPGPRGEAGRGPRPRCSRPSPTRPTGSPTRSRRSGGRRGPRRRADEAAGRADPGRRARRTARPAAVRRRAAVLAGSVAVRPGAGALRARGMPVEVVGLGGLLATPEVRDVVGTLRVLADPTAGAALVRLLTGPRWRIAAARPRSRSAAGPGAAGRAGARRPAAG